MEQMKQNSNRYQLRKPLKAYVTKDNVSTLVGFGIGDILEVVEAADRHPMMHGLNDYLHRKLPIQLLDGSAITTLLGDVDATLMYDREETVDRRGRCLNE